MPHDFSLSTGVVPSGKTAFYAQLNNSAEAKFFVGYRTRYEQVNFGLYNTIVKTGQEIYEPSIFAPQFDFWAHFIYPTAMAESNGSYWCLNTYDRAKFTFSFMQYAAHVPNGDFVLFFKKLLGLNNGTDYFPRLVIKEGRIFYRNSNGTLDQLESDTSSQKLMNYLNPSLNEVEHQEHICAARMVHWAMNDPGNRLIQVETAIDHFKKNMIDYDARFNLDGVPAKVCQMICDIRHQGRGTNDRIANALNTGGDFEKAFNNLCTIGEANYKPRIDTVKKTIKTLEQAGIFNKRYERARNTFVNM
ncbi:MAG TPA: hypothetical protein VNM35_09505 [Chitinophagaceae bacterium]|jgi:hypothetical protein|nr:hypothetical protein [Chitinophagaceae bacterium]